MSITSGFFNSVNHDRRYTAEQMSAIFNGIINDGVFINIGTAFSVSPDTGNQVRVGVGRAWLKSTWINNDAVAILDLGPSELLRDRIDAIVLEANRSPLVRLGDIKVVKGPTDGDVAKKPVLLNTAEIKQMPICYITRPKNSTNILQGNIEYCVGTTACPYVTGILQTLSVDNLIAQWRGQWNEWFDQKQDETDAKILKWSEDWDEWFNATKDNTLDLTVANQKVFDDWFRDVQYQLSEDAAGKLLNKINSLAKVTNNESHGTMSKVGWYRIARQANDGADNQHGSSMTFIIDVTRTYNGSVNETHKLIFTATNGKYEFESLMDITQAHLLTQIRVSKYPGNNMRDIYLYYGSAASNDVQVTFRGAGAECFNVLVENTAYSTSELNSLGTELVTYDIPSSFHLRGIGISGKIFTGNIDNLFGNSLSSGYLVQSTTASGTQPWGDANCKYYLFLDSRSGGYLQTAIRFDTGEMKSRVYDNSWYQWTKLEDYLTLSGGMMTGLLKMANTSGLVLYDSKADHTSYPLFEAKDDISGSIEAGYLLLGSKDRERAYRLGFRANQTSADYAAALYLDMLHWGTGETGSTTLMRFGNGEMLVHGGLTYLTDKVAGSYLNGNKKGSIITSAAGAGAYVMLDRLNSTNGYFTDGVYQKKRIFQYTAKSTVDSGTNNITKTLTLLDEDGNTSLPGNLSAKTGQFSNLELTSATPYIDFHYNNSGSDYTSRIIENASGKLNIIAPNGIQMNGQAMADQIVAEGHSGTSRYWKWLNGLAIVLSDVLKWQDGPNGSWVNFTNISSSFKYSYHLTRYYYPFSFVEDPMVDFFITEIWNGQTVSEEDNPTYNDPIWFAVAERLPDSSHSKRTSISPTYRLVSRNNSDDPADLYYRVLAIGRWK